MSNTMQKKLFAFIIAFSAISAVMTVVSAQQTKQPDLLIKKSDLSDRVKFYPYRSGGTYMEIMAVRAPDGTIRTAFNTCQVCFDSGRGYYVQKGNVVVCQNCGNRFRIDQIEKIKGGCNPVPIAKENKIETRETIRIPAAFIAQFRQLFTRWKR
jgi:hypothetical protein